MAFVLELSDDTGRTVNFIANAQYSLEEGGLRITPPDKRQIQGGPSYYIHGQKLLSTTYANRDIDVTFEVSGTSWEDIGDRIATIERILERARQAQDMVNASMSVALKFQVNGMTSPTYFKVLDGEFSMPSSLMSAAGVHWKSGNLYKLKGCSLELVCEPFAYSASPHLTWEDTSGDRPTEVGLRNESTSGLYSTGGVAVDNGTDSTRDNSLHLLASSVGGDQQAAAIMVIENSSASFEDFGKAYIGAALGTAYFTLNGAVNNSVTSFVVDEDLSPYKTPIHMIVDTEEVLVTAINKTTKTLTVTRGYNSTTPASHSDAAELRNLSMNPFLNSNAGDYTGLSSPDVATNYALAAALGGHYKELTITGSGIKNLVTWDMTKDQVSAQQGLVRIFGRLSEQGSGGQAAGKYWSTKVKYRLVFRYLSRSGNDPVVHTTDWVLPLDTTTQLIDFGSVRIPPFGVSGKDYTSEISITIQAEIKSTYTSDTIYLNLDYITLLPIEYGYRVFETRGEGLARGDTIIDDGWKGIAYVEQIASYPSGESLGKASIVNAFLSPIWIQPGFDQRFYFLQEAESGLADPGRELTVKMYIVNSYLNLVV